VKFPIVQNQLLRSSLQIVQEKHKEYCLCYTIKVVNKVNYTVKGVFAIWQVGVVTSVQFKLVKMKL